MPTIHAIRTGLVKVKLAQMEGARQGTGADGAGAGLPACDGGAAGTCGEGACGVAFWVKAAGSQAAPATARTNRYVVMRSCIQFLSDCWG